MDNTTTLDDIKNLVEEFVTQREWQQFHNPKNLAMALVIEASELMNLFKWQTIQESIDSMGEEDIRNAATDEIADIIIYSLAFANRNKIDLSEAVRGKLIKNNEKYPVGKYKGRF